MLVESWEHWLLGILHLNKSEYFNLTLTTTENVKWFRRANDQQVPMAVIHKVLMHKRIHFRNNFQNVNDNNHGNHESTLVKNQIEL